jgi:hypothetical protein
MACWFIQFPIYSNPWLIFLFLFECLKVKKRFNEAIMPRLNYGWKIKKIPKGTIKHDESIDTT